MDPIKVNETEEKFLNAVLANPKENMNTIYIIPRHDVIFPNLKSAYQTAYRIKNVLIAKGLLRKYGNPGENLVEYTGIPFEIGKYEHTTSYRGNQNEMITEDAFKTRKSGSILVDLASEYRAQIIQLQDVGALYTFVIRPTRNEFNSKQWQSFTTVIKEVIESPSYTALFMPSKNLLEKLKPFFQYMQENEWAKIAYANEFRGHIPTTIISNASKVALFKVLLRVLEEQPRKNALEASEGAEAEETV